MLLTTESSSTSIRYVQLGRTPPIHVSPREYVVSCSLLISLGYLPVDLSLKTLTSRPFQLSAAAILGLNESTVRMANIPSKSGSSLSTQLTRSYCAVTCVPYTGLLKSLVTTVPLPMHDEQTTNVSKIPSMVLFFCDSSVRRSHDGSVPRVRQWKSVQCPGGPDTNRPQYGSHHRPCTERGLSPKSSVVPCRSLPQSASLFKHSNRRRSVNRYSQILRLHSGRLTYATHYNFRGSEPVPASGSISPHVI